MSEPRILTLDIETAPMTVWVFGLFDQNIGLDQIKQDWHLLSWSAKWLGDSKVHYMDNRHAKNIANDKRLVKGIIKLLNQADIVITQNGDAFDLKRIADRANFHKLRPFKPVRSVDIYKEEKKVFGSTSHKLAYKAQRNEKYKKLAHGKYPNFHLWRAIMLGDKHAWVEMERYNRHDVLATEERYLRVQGWIKTQNLATFADDFKTRCMCGSDQLVKQGYAHTDNGKFQIYQCKACGKWPRSAVNLLSKAKKRSLLKGGKGR